MSKMHRAAERGDVKVISGFLTRRKAPDEPDATGRTPLSLVVRHGLVPAVQALLAAGATVDSVDWVGRSPLFYAAQAREPEVVATLIEAGADPNRADEGGITPLMAAIGMHEMKYFDMEGLHFDLLPAPAKEVRTVRALLAGGADPNLADAAGRTAAHHAAWKLNPSVFALLRDVGAHLSLRDEKGQSPEWYVMFQTIGLTFDDDRADLINAREDIVSMINGSR
jgi:ankyrin repeat protein